MFENIYTSNPWPEKKLISSLSRCKKKETRTHRHFPGPPKRTWRSWRLGGLKSYNEMSE
jgi:hypothetical protein